MTSHHGNPTVLLPCSHGGGRVVVCARNGQELWISHGVPDGQGAVTVDVGNGRFVGDADGWAVLPPGNYLLSWRPFAKPPTQLEPLEVEPEHLFDDAPQPARESSDETWLASGTSCAFREGAMHGVLSAQFVAKGNLTDGAQWGLISRHYSAFHHVRVICAREGRNWSVRLVRVANEPPDLASHIVLAEKLIAGEPSFPQALAWSFNGDRHEVSVNGQLLLTARDGYMGGVNIVGVHADAQDIVCARASMHTTQSVFRHSIERPEYVASIRPGNIDRLFLTRSAAPWQNVCWESGVQFGHIGGSEIKFTQGASLRMIDDGPVATAVTWDGPMPKFVEQSRDVRGWARGVATFYSDHIVIADDVLAWTNRSVGPDIDLLGRLMASPARLAVAGSDKFFDWALPRDGAMVFADLTPESGPAFPVAAAFPLLLGRQKWWLKTLILLRNPPADETPGSAFAWQCPHGLTASHDFRCSPTRPGQEYSFTIVVGWQRSEDADAVEAELLTWRSQWLRPMRVSTVAGRAVVYESARDAPREAMNIEGCFDRSSGRYVIMAPAEGDLVIQLDPDGVRRRNVTLAVRHDRRLRSVSRCALDGRPLKIDTDVVIQNASDGETWVRLLVDLTQAATLIVSFDNAQRTVSA